MRYLTAAALLLSAALAEETPEAKSAAVRATCDSLAAGVADLLGKPFEKPVPVSLRSREFLRTFISDYQKRLIPDDLRRASQILAERMRLVPTGYDVEGKQVELAVSQLAGLYDPETREFFVADTVGDLQGLEFQVTAAHELTHAWRDIHTDFWRRLRTSMAVDIDWFLALSCLIEGDASLVGQAVGLARPSGADARQAMGMVCQQFADPRAARLAMSSMTTMMGDFPRALRESLIGRYRDGMIFAAAVWKAGGFPALARAFAEPPRSTEQVIHPEKYLGPEVDEPTVFSGGDPTAALGEGWKVLLANTSGEFDVKVLFHEPLGALRAEQVAAGWDGTRVHLCIKEGAPAFVGTVSTWDTEADAREFADAWLEWAGKRDGSASATRSLGTDSVVATREGLVAVRVSGKDVFVADGIPSEERVGPVLEALSKVERRERTAADKP